MAQVICIFLTFSLYPSDTLYPYNYSLYLHNMCSIPVKMHYIPNMAQIICIFLTCSLSPSKQLKKELSLSCVFQNHKLKYYNIKTDKKQISTKYRTSTKSKSTNVRQMFSYYWFWD